MALGSTRPTRVWSPYFSVLALVAIYRLPDFVSGVMANPLYIDLGFSNTDIATVSKLYGVWVGLAGAVVGNRRDVWHRQSFRSPNRVRARFTARAASASVSAVGLSARPPRVGLTVLSPPKAG